MQDLSSFFLLRKDITFLNFGSFGACVKPVFDRYQQYQLELEQEPVQFITVTGPIYLENSRQALGAYLNCHQDDLVYVTNPSYAVNIVAKSLAFQPGDEILTTDIEYGACDTAWEYYCQKTGAVYKKQRIRFPIESKEDFIEQFFAGLTPKTKMIFISHLTSSTGLRLPVEEICRLAKEKGLLTFVDGAHGPAQVPVNLQTLQADMYTGACHKWMMTPKGSSFLYVKKEMQPLLDPLIISWGYKAMFPSSSPFLDYHQMQGTRDFSAFLTIPDAIHFMADHDWKTVAAECRAMVQGNAAAFCERLGAKPLAPVNDDFIAQLYSAEIKTTEPEKLKAHLYNDYNIEVPVMRHADKVYLRYSINAFNKQADLDRLFDAIRSIKMKTAFIEG
ncbi:MAG: aminotransferase class V-fold PLP-dependent enzyme [Chitinophagaceae bacterium]|nr:aminotransferase class V-fold PLP-dependent enzyme [Chitinophagaceae bacterium]